MSASKNPRTADPLAAADAEPGWTANEALAPDDDRAADDGPTPASGAGRGPWFTRDRPLGIFLIIASAIGFIASFDLSVDKVKKLEQPDRVLSCDFNPFFSCGSVMRFPQSQLFGFPNQFLGIMAFVVPLLLGILLVSRTPIPRWVMIGLNVGLALGTVFVMFLFITSIYVIGIGCPWCIVVWSVTIPMFCIVTARNALTGAFGAGIADSTGTYALASNAVFAAVAWMLVIYGCIVLHFWPYFSSLIG
ncbi:vitamin K epoxide reductase family protein [Brevibacterium sp. BRM-1]|uniref:vitamin K epoxide reductase family protein n=1 Tax=Brevibacterium sp. BRM-1 TaxID=2999062 RepID=UPI00228247BA|nr:vitamin K epoxide reductase family protein [Brevibacterium sp. BRM-1]WAL40598.1 vitamin K epoxide reductase family protein [Brevibacterium sp. BRM-1]